MSWSRIAAALALPALLASAGCQSTQEKSREIGESLEPATAEAGLKIAKESSVVKVLDSTVLGAQGQAAVVVTLRNDSDRVLTGVPILIDVRDAKGKSVYRNDVPGIEPALASVPIIRPGQRLDWVHDQVLASGKPTSVEVTVGEGGEVLAGGVPEVEVRQPEQENDAVSGRNARGTATNKGDQRQERVLIFGVARRGGRIVAAGRAAIENLKPGKTAVYRIYFVGDPTRADLSIASFPTVDPS